MKSVMLRDGVGQGQSTQGLEDQVGFVLSIMGNHLESFK